MNVNRTTSQVFKRPSLRYILAIFTVLCVAAVCIRASYVKGSEISLAYLDVRHCSHYEMPLIKSKIGHSCISDHRLGLGNYLRSRYPDRIANREWLFIKGNRSGNVRGWIGYGNVLYRTFYYPPGKDDELVVWSRAVPMEADRFWRLIFYLLDNEQYESAEYVVGVILEIRDNTDLITSTLNDLENAMYP